MAQGKPPEGPGEFEKPSGKHDDATKSSSDSDEAEQMAPPPPPNTATDTVPNGGLQAWLQVLGSWILFFNTWGTLNTFGVYQTFYERGTIFAESSSNIAWIGSLQSLMLLTVGAFVGPIYDRGRLRWLLVIGSFGIVFGHMMLSLCETYWQVVLAQGFLIGIGGGCLYVPAVAILPSYFSSKLGMALGIAASGSSTGGMIYPVVFYRLIGQIGFSWAVRVMGFMALAMLLVALAVMRMRVASGKVRSLVDWTAFTDWPYLLFIAGLLLGLAGCYVFFFYTPFFGLSTGITDANLAFYLIPILNAASIFGRTFLTWLSDKTGLFNVMAPAALMVSAILWCNLAVFDAGGLIATTAMLGFFTGVFVALPPAVFVSLTRDKSKIGTRIGMGLAIAGTGVLAGGPGGGAILGTNDGDLHWKSAWIYAAVATMAAGVIFSTLRVWRGGFRLMVKV